LAGLAQKKPIASFAAPSTIVLVAVIAHFKVISRDELFAALAQEDMQQGMLKCIIRRLDFLATLACCAAQFRVTPAALTLSLA
jgi:hypothetical protein